MIGPEAGVLKAAAPASIMGPNIMTPEAGLLNEPELVAASCDRFTVPEQDEEAGAPLESGTNGTFWT